MDEELKKNILKTGTSIIGIKCKDGVVVAGDRQVTAGNIVYKKNVAKIVDINDYLVGAWTGGVSDSQMLKKLVAAELRLKELKSKERPTVKEGANLFATISYQKVRQFSTIPSIVGSLIAGYNKDGSTELYTVGPTGSIYEVDDYDANFSSGMPYILGLLERQYKEDMTVEDGVKLAIEAIKSSTQRDVGSGYGIDVFAITKEGINHQVKQKIEAGYKEEIKEQGKKSKK